jgi:hypothetical protein
VDCSELIRRNPPQDDWNEWGYFDYKDLNDNVTSYNCKITEFTPAGKYDAITSICSLAHMLAAERLATLEDVSNGYIRAEYSC